jgi:tRNA-2-methylthio-N6-dimethylallyladenosine synthase
MEDDVPEEEKDRRFRLIEDMQAPIVAAINTKYLGQTVQVLVEENHKGKWRGRTPQNKLVFFEDTSTDWRGKLADVEITWTGPWSMQGRLPSTQPKDEPLIVLAG